MASSVTETGVITGPHADDAQLVRAAIAATPDPREGKSGPIPAVVFATSVALANPRTLRRYLAGDRPLPPLLREKCQAIIAADREAARAKRSRAAKLGRRRSKLVR
jgi:hypothetical protein